MLAGSFFWGELNSIQAPGEVPDFEKTHKCHGKMKVCFGRLRMVMDSMDPFQILGQCSDYCQGNQPWPTRRFNRGSGYSGSFTFELVTKLTDHSLRNVRVPSMCFFRRFEHHLGPFKVSSFWWKPNLLDSPQSRSGQALDVDDNHKERARGDVREWRKFAEAMPLKFEGLVCTGVISWTKLSASFLTSPRHPVVFFCPFCLNGVPH